MASAVERQAKRWRCGRLHSLYVRSKDPGALLGYIVICMHLNLAR